MKQVDIFNFLRLGEDRWVLFDLIVEAVGTGAASLSPGSRLSSALPLSWVR